MSWSWSEIIIVSGVIVVVATFSLAAFVVEAVREDNRRCEERWGCERGKIDEPLVPREPYPLPEPCELPEPVLHEPELLEPLESLEPLETIV